MKRNRFLLGTLLALALSALACVVHAEDYPMQTIRLIVPWPPGGATDVIGRLMAQALTQRLGQTVIVENKPGAGGNIGTAQVARSKPDGYTLVMATSSTNAAKIDILHVPYKGSGPAAADLIAGHISMMLDTGSLPHITSGRLRALAVASKARLGVLPDVPTFDEIGFKGMYASAWYGIMAPAGTPRAIVERLNREANAALQSPELRKHLIEFGAEIGGGTPDEFAAFAVSELKRYEEIVAISGARKEQ